jgi:hypothetical protein
LGVFVPPRGSDAVNPAVALAPIITIRCHGEVSALFVEADDATLPVETASLALAQQTINATARLPNHAVKPIKHC